MRSWKLGDTLEVIDDQPSRPGGRRPPFRKGAVVVIDKISPGERGLPGSGVKLKGIGGFWNFNRFEVRRG